MRRLARLLGVLAALLLVAGCGLIPGPGADIAARIRAANSPIVREVEFYPASAGLAEGGPETIDVYLIDAPTDAQALDLWCNVIVPAGVDEMPPGNLKFYKGGRLTTLGDRMGATLVLPNPVCGGGESPTPTR